VLKLSFGKKLEKEFDMNTQELEAMVRTQQEQINALQEQVRTLRDIDEIKKLQRAYGYYLENWMTDEVADLFSDSPDTIVLVHAGEFRGKEGVRRFFRSRGENRGRRPAEFFHQVMQLSPVIDVAPDGKRAWGRWYGFGANATPVQDGVFQGWMNGVYENEYIKENGKWKILKLGWYMYFFAPYFKGWVAPERQCDKDFQHQPPDLSPDGPSRDTFYPSPFICPFHFKHPVTGMPTPVNQL
jgi:hypothetical protein